MLLAPLPLSASTGQPVSQTAAPLPASTGQPVSQPAAPLPATSHHHTLCWWLCCRQSFGPLRICIFTTYRHQQLWNIYNEIKYNLSVYLQCRPNIKTCEIGIFWSNFYQNRQSWHIAKNIWPLWPLKIGQGHPFSDSSESRIWTTPPAEMAVLLQFLKNVEC